MMQGKRRVGKIQMRNLPSDPVLHYLLDRNEPSATKALASSIKQRRNEKAARLNITLPEVRSISEDEMFKVVTTGKKTHQRSWKRIVTKPIFVGEGFTRQNPKAERFIRFTDGTSSEVRPCQPSYLRRHIEGPDLIRQEEPTEPDVHSPWSLKRRAVVEVNASELGLTTTSGKAVWGRYAQTTDNPEGEGS
uniref:60s ribosomal protein n=1 Tax=Colletotrichum fructicola (strain Nara gc5) TaxID=1213859 RepID=L2GHL6_COLFN